MDDRAFRAELDRCFAETPGFADADEFSMRVSQRLDRAWMVRQTVIGGLGLVGGLIGAVQLISSGLLPRVSALLSQSDALGRLAVANGPAARALNSMAQAGASVDGQIVWMLAASAALGAGVVAIRATREL